jgi:hypothetical protein
MILDLNISLCNLVYKLISKIIANRLKGIMLGALFEEQFGFLFNRKIHDAMDQPRKFYIQ